MGKLTALKPRLTTLRSTIARLPQGRQEYDRERDKQGWRKWYKTARWRKLRWSVLVRDGFTCRMCKLMMTDTSQLVADHIIRHGGDETKFFDANGLQTLCATCHNSTKQRQEYGR